MSKILLIGASSAIAQALQENSDKEFIALSQKTNIDGFKKFVDITKMIENGVKKYKSEVLKKQFPKAKHSFSK